MRLTLKITTAILLGVALLFSIHSYLSIQRERSEIKERLSREARQFGQSLSVVLMEIWRRDGAETAIRFLDSANQIGIPLKVRWIWLDGPAESRFLPRLPLEKLSPLRNGVTVTLLGESQEGHDFLLTYLPVKPVSGRLGAIELSESLDELHGYIQESLRRSALLMAVTIASGLLLMTLLGSLWINRPVRRLTEQAQRIGTGDFTRSLTVTGGDELAKLGSSIEEMRNQLAEARVVEQSANQAKLDSLEKLRHTDRLATLGRLSAGMAHELGTPLNVISGRASLIADHDLTPEETTRSARIIGEQAERMTAIMRQLLDFARRGEARKRPVEMQGLIRGVVELLAPTARKQGVELQWQPGEEPLTVHADPGQLQQVLLNLAMNGIQAMPQGGGLRLSLEPCTPPETVTDATAEEWCYISVEDQGSGIAPHDLPQIFDPFFTTKDVGQGTGLGLSIAYGIIEEHGGRIEVTSTLDSGSTFRVYLPLITPGERI